MTNKELLMLTREMALDGLHQNLEHLRRVLPESVADESKAASYALHDLMRAVRELDK